MWEGCLCKLTHNSIFMKVSYAYNANVNMKAQTIAINVTSEPSTGAH